LSRPGRRILGALATALTFLALTSSAWARPQIVGGAPAPAGTWPSTAFLYGEYRDAPFGCTGSVVAPQWIVTAAHCAYGAPGVYADRMRAVLNAKDYTDPAGEVIGIDRLVVAPGYDAATDRNDIAMFHLVQPTTAPAIRLAIKPELAGYVSFIDVPNAAGWGRTDVKSTVSTTVLQQAYLRVWKADECRNRPIPGFDASTQVCAGTEGKAGACHGDSGGPLVAFDRATREPVLWGVTSYGPQAALHLDPCSTSAPVVFTWVPAFTDFITGTAASLPPSTSPEPAPPPVPAGPVPPAPTTPSSACLSARAKLVSAKKAEKTALKRLQALRKRKHADRRRERAASKLYHQRRTKRLRASAAVGKACPTPS
jgi:secreted trypsin-like serine protease